MRSGECLENNGTAALRERLRDVRFVGGGSGAGKTTIARRIATERSLQYYSTDDAMGKQASRINPEDCPLLDRFMAMTMDERWVDRSPQTMLETFHWFQGEGFLLIVGNFHPLAF